MLTLLLYGGQIAAKRKQLGLSQTELARKAILSNAVRGFRVQQDSSPVLFDCLIHRETEKHAIPCFPHSS